MQTRGRPIEVPRHPVPTTAITALIDTREQLPLDLPGLHCQPATLATGDYSLRGMEAAVALERKSLPDLLACCGRERERFDREVQRLLAYPVRALVVEASWTDIEVGDWRSRLTPKQVGAVAAVVAGARLAGRHGGRSPHGWHHRCWHVRRAAIHQWRELRTFAGGLDQ